MSDVSAERQERLRRAAFRRGATQGDLDAWAAVAGTQPTVPADDVAPGDVVPGDRAPEGADSPSEEAPVGMPELASPRRLAVALPIAAGLVGLLAGGAIGGAVFAPERTSSLTVFDRPAPEDDPRSAIFDSQNGFQADGGVPWYQVHGDQRVLHDGDDFRAWAALGTENIGSTEVQGWRTVVCLAVEFPDGSGTGSCETLDEFAADGIRLPGPRDGDDRVFAWGPTGGLVVESSP